MSVLVTGASGFVGSAVLRRFASHGYRLRALVRPGSARRNLEGLDVEVVEGNLRDPSSLAAAVAGCSGLVHVAADYRLWVPDEDEMYQCNVTGTVDLVSQAVLAGVERIVYTSSVATLGIRRDRVAGDESTPVGFNDMVGHYKRSKFLAEQVVLAGVREHGWPVVVVNPSTPLGPRDVKPTPTGRMVVDAARGALPAYVDTGLNVVHVDDVAHGHLLAYERGEVGERYILGGEDMTLEKILAQVAGLTGRRPPRVRLPHLAVLPVAAVSEVAARVFGFEPLATVDAVRMSMKHMYFSCAKAQRELGYEHRPAAEAIADAVRWFAAHGYLDRS